MNRKILFIEDNRDLAWSYEKILSVLPNREVSIIYSVAEMIERREQVLASDVIFIDISLGPGQPNGIDAYEWLKKENFKGKAYFLTGHAMSNPLVQRASEVGAIEVLGKPLDISLFLEMIDTRTRDVL